jgi:hypothetical protein
VQQAPRVQVEEEVPGFIRRLVHALAHPESAGQVAQHVDVSEARDRGVCHGVRLRLLA